jgi:hypothetical protein
MKRINLHRRLAGMVEVDLRVWIRGEMRVLGSLFRCWFHESTPFVSQALCYRTQSSPARYQYCHPTDPSQISLTQCDPYQRIKQYSFANHKVRVRRLECLPVPRHHHDVATPSEGHALRLSFVLELQRVGFSGRGCDVQYLPITLQEI